MGQIELARNHCGTVTCHNSFKTSSAGWSDACKSSMHDDDGAFHMMDQMYKKRVIRITATTSSNCNPHSQLVDPFCRRRNQAYTLFWHGWWNRLMRSGYGWNCCWFALVVDIKRIRYCYDGCIFPQPAKLRSSLVVILHKSAVRRWRWKAGKRV